MRRKPSAPSSNASRKTDTELGLVTQIRKYQLITPLFGGGVEAGKNDSQMPINGKSIRGQLRFWWRATRGSNEHVRATLLALGLPIVKTDAQGNQIPLTDLEKLRKLEGEIWGLASGNSGQPSSVQLHITLDAPGQTIDYNNENRNFKYGAFPMQTAQHQSLQENIQFTLEVSYESKFQEEVSAALWAWESFGGVGARTRRGFGAIHCCEIDSQTREFTRDQAEDQINAGFETTLGHLQGNTWHTAVPHLSSLISKRVFTNASWRSMLGSLKDFRQSRPPGNPAGRSDWSEPDAIRKLKSPPNWTSSARHNAPTVWNTPQLELFPRAVFGLPILFHFRNDNNPGEPSDTTLRGLDLRTPTNKSAPNYERLASRLIFRPLKCNDGDMCIAIVLDGPETPPDGLMLKDAVGNPKVSHKLTSAAVAWRIKPLKTNVPNVGQTDVLQAFLDSL